LVPDVTFLITGSKRKAESLGFLRDVPPNVRFTDYLELEEFERLLADAAVVMGLTSEEGVQLSVANEALGADKALVLSDTRILREMFGAAALFAKNTPEDWAARLHEALARRAELEARSAALKTRRIEDWRAPAEAVARRLAS
jgi:glycosyltransferase involved in cell wall biosynthesis